MAILWGQKLYDSSGQAYEVLNPAYPGNADLVLNLRRVKAKEHAAMGGFPKHPKRLTDEHGTVYEVTSNRSTFTADMDGHGYWEGGKLRIVPPFVPGWYQWQNDDRTDLFLYGVRWHHKQDPNSTGASLSGKPGRYVRKAVNDA